MIKCVEQRHGCTGEVTNRALEREDPVITHAQLFSKLTLKFLQNIAYVYL